MTQAERDAYFEKKLSELSESEIAKMEHAIGYRGGKGSYTRKGTRYLKPYRNYYDAGGTDVAIWNGLVKKGCAECLREDDRGGAYFKLTNQGLNILSAAKKCFIYSENARGNVADAWPDVVEAMLTREVFCGYGCWFPISAREISLKARLPMSLVKDALHYLRDEKGYVANDYYGDCDPEEGTLCCVHGWCLTKKWKEGHKEQYEAAQRAEYKRMTDFDRELEIEDLRREEEAKA